MNFNWSFDWARKSLYDDEQAAIRRLEAAMKGGLPETQAIPIGPASGGTGTQKNRTWLVAGAVVLGLLLLWR